LFSAVGIVRLPTGRCKDDAQYDSLLHNLYSSMNTACTDAAGRRPRDARTRCVNMRAMTAHLSWWLCSARHRPISAEKILRISAADVAQRGFYVLLRFSAAKFYDFYISGNRRRVVSTLHNVAFLLSFEMCVTNHFIKARVK